MESLIEIGLFSGKVAVIAVAIAVILILFFSLISRARQTKALLNVQNLNEKFDQMAQALQESVFDPKAQKAEAKRQKKRAKLEKKQSEEKKHIYVLDFEGDIRASHVDHLREEITALLTIAKPGRDEAVVRIESPGGVVHTYGLAAAQLARLREAGIHLTVCVDKVAASGGYLMACTAERILASPFAIVGSIGVVAQVPNFHRLLKKHDIDYEELTAGEFKRTISHFGEITEKGRSKFLNQIEDIHAMFKDFVKSYRPQLNLEQVATGEYWYGNKAKELGLIDDVIPSDQYLFQQRHTAKIFKIEMAAHKKWSEKLAENIAMAFENSIERIFNRFVV